MTKIDRNYFNYYIEEVNKYVDGVHFLNPGIEDDTLIEEAEKRIGVKLPEEYKMFLKLNNGGELFRPGTVLSQIYAEPSDRIRGWYYLNDVFDERYRVSEIPDNLMFIATMSYGDKVCIDTAESSEFAKIVLWDFENMEISQSWMTLRDWLADELEVGRMLVDYDGTKKRLTFLNRNTK